MKSNHELSLYQIRTENISDQQNFFEFTKYIVCVWVRIHRQNTVMIIFYIQLPDTQQFSLPLCTYEFDYTPTRLIIFHLQQK